MRKMNRKAEDKIAGALVCVFVLAAFSAAACPDRISYFSEFKQWEEQDVAQNSTCAFSWEVQSFVERWPSPLDLEREFPWQKSEEAVKRCLSPRRMFNPAIDSVLEIAKNHDLSARVLKHDGLTFLVIGDCRLSAVLCIDETNKAFDVEMDYGCNDEYVRRPRPICVGDGCGRWEMRKELSKAEIVRRVEILAEAADTCAPLLCLGLQSASPRIPSAYGYECPYHGNKQREKAGEEDWVERFLLMRIPQEEEELELPINAPGSFHHPSYEDGWCSSMIKKKKRQTADTATEGTER